MKVDWPTQRGRSRRVVRVYKVGRAATYGSQPREVVCEVRGSGGPPPHRLHVETSLATPRATPEKFLTLRLVRRWTNRQGHTGSQESVSGGPNKFGPLLAHTSPILAAASSRGRRNGATHPGHRQGPKGGLPALAATRIHITPESSTARQMRSDRRRRGGHAQRSSTIEPRERSASEHPNNANATSKSQQILKSQIGPHRTIQSRGSVATPRGDVWRPISWRWYVRYQR